MLVLLPRCLGTARVGLLAPIDPKAEKAPGRVGMAQTTGDMSNFQITGIIYLNG